MANQVANNSRHQCTNQTDRSAKIGKQMDDQEATSYKLFQRATETLILFQGCPDPKLNKFLETSNVSIGVLLSSDEFKSCPSISKYSYALIGTVKDKRPSYTHAIKELSLNGWKIVDPSKETLTHIGSNFLAIIAKQPTNINKIA